MTREVRTVVYDPDLQLEAYRFEGIMQKFPNHFHDYYVIGFIEGGKRHLVCNQEEYMLNSGDIIIFNPGDPHACEQVDGRTLDYRCLNIEPEVMQRYASEITGHDVMPRFTTHVLFQNELVDTLQEVHELILSEQQDFCKEELLFVLLEQLISEHSDTRQTNAEQEPTVEITRVCAYIETHYMGSIALDELSDLANLSKYHLLRLFTRQKGISPYRYLETIRINHAKRLLEQGLLPIEVACRTGFSDQSHFTNFFKKLIGLTPRQYRRIFNHEQNTSVVLSHAETASNLT